MSTVDTETVVVVDVPTTNDSDRYDDEDSLSMLLDSISTDGPDDSRPASPASVDGIDAAIARKTHWKSRSAGEAIIGANVEETNVNFSRNRELWQKRASSQSTIDRRSPLGIVSNRHSESWTQRRKHTPDLVMDLPPTGNSSPKDVNQKSVVTQEATVSGDDEPPRLVTPLEIGSTRTGPESPDMSTAAERFAKPNQCTLKKNTKATSERIRSDLDQDTENTVSETEAPTRSPVQSRVTHKYVAKFADMHLTGSYKPQVKAKPQILRKPALPVVTHPSTDLAKDP